MIIYRFTTMQHYEIIWKRITIIIHLMWVSMILVFMEIKITCLIYRTRFTQFIGHLEGEFYFEPGKAGGLHWRDEVLFQFIAIQMGKPLHNVSQISHCLHCNCRVAPRDTKSPTFNEKIAFKNIVCYLPAKLSRDGCVKVLKETGRINPTEGSPASLRFD